MTFPNLKIEQTDENLYDSLGSAGTSPFVEPLVAAAKDGKARKVTVAEADVDKTRQHIRQVGSKHNLSVKTKDRPAGNGQVTIVFQAKPKQEKSNGNAAPTGKGTK